DGIVALAGDAQFSARRGNSMIIALLIAGIGMLLAGLIAIGFGIPVKEFSFGNTLILIGTVAACCGLIMLGLWAVVRELNRIARRPGPDFVAKPRAQPALSLAAATATPANQTAESGYAETAAASPAVPWQD